MKLKTFISKLKRSFSVETIKSSASKILYKEDKKILALLKAHSPYDPDHKPAGEKHFRDNWKVTRPRFGSSKTLAGIKIINDTPDYGQFAALGAEPNEAPWYFPHRDRSTGRFKKGTGKLKLVNGKVWAGGLNPGHDKTVGGPIAQVLSKYTDKFTQEFADGFVKGFV